MSTDQEFWDWLWDDDPQGAAPPPRGVSTDTIAQPRPPAVEDEDGGAPSEAEGPAEDREEAGPAPSRPRRRWRLLLVAAAAVLGAAVAALALVLPDDAADRPGGAGAGGPFFGDQRIVTWTIWDDKKGEKPFLAVIASGGGKEPAAVVIPENTAANIPGRGYAPIQEAVTGRGVTDAVAATVENILGVRVDGSVRTSIEDLGRKVEQVGGIQAGLEHLDGPGTVEYLRDAHAVDRAIRWQEVVAGVLAAIPGHPGALESIPPSFRSPFMGGGREVDILPFEEIGSGLVRPDEDAVAELVQERLVPTGTADKVRLVVLNGNGTPGVGEDVARLLVPEGFTLVATQNAASFDQEETRVVASSQEFVDDANRALRLLGTGKVYLSGVPTYLSDVTIIVGKDFTLDDAGGP
jgi:LytR cell envelope-related transcriptional attenuator